VTSSQDLDGLLVGRQDILVWTETLSLPKSSIQVQDHASLLDKRWVTREEPVSISPRLQRILAQDATQACVTETSQTFFLDNDLEQIGDFTTGRFSKMLTHSML
jgi:hypothetical protein